VGIGGELLSRKRSFHLLRLFSVVPYLRHNPAALASPRSKLNTMATFSSTLRFFGLSFPILHLGLPPS